MKVNRLLILLIFIGTQIFSIADDSDTTDTRSYKEKLYSGDYTPYVKIDSNDKLKYPLELQLEVLVNQLRNINIKKTDFYAAFEYLAYTTVDSVEITTNNDTLYFRDPDDFLFLIYPESDRLFTTDWKYDLKDKQDLIKDSVHQWSKYIESDFPKKWNLRNYPFDKQKFSFVFEALGDTSWLTLNESIQFPPEIIKENFPYLIDGLSIQDFSTEKKYKTSEVKSDFADGFRNEVREQLIFNIIVDRDGSYLYFKLFFGGFLSFLISFLVYFIGKNQFDTRITLSLGGIFGSVGNKYFVENSMPTVQVLTKADLINNLVIIFIILNIFIVIGQHTKKINLWKFEENTFSATFIFILFVLVNLFVINF